MKKEFHLELNENEVVIFSPSKFTEPTTPRPDI
jgi:hypothetical protein